MDIQTSSLLLLLPFLPLLIPCMFIYFLPIFSYRATARTHFSLLLGFFHINSSNGDASDDVGGDPGVRRYFTLNQPAAESETKQAECAICLCKIEEGEEIRELRCEHLFHRVCLDRWIGYRQSSCPLCRGSIMPASRMTARLSGGNEEVVEEIVFMFSSFQRSDARERWWLR
ncbi:PREDICTED: E3 ubiquitin-protein ligase RHA2A-like [Nelumbo nucifera]|uniref:E3 ubiquitin-protein ligase RHA2A-like n=2 Tax=Nelumbo nucifera TaxID=4432 RepID=A0A1U8A4P4_NELNU|nr:PREDICTED: E3 ubiquitin-protein ligase RHA2A-like [Nelumbo nucifera]DAD35188.1 TPA_asm: hypothetical protein HUJ06_005828 [Nelumbo nucifera]